jgi:multicomponent Na+:H+ antiporter subunit E
MNLLILNVLLAFTWAALTGQFTLENLVIGFLLGYLTMYLTRSTTGGNKYFVRAGQLLHFLVYFVWELLIANLRVARDVLRPGPLRLKPRVISVPLDRYCGDIEVTLLANVLSLTPGTLSLDVSRDHNHCLLFVHAIHAPDAQETRMQIKSGFQQLVFNLFRRSQECPPAEPKGEQ